MNKIAMSDEREREKAAYPPQMSKEQLLSDARDAGWTKEQLEHLIETDDELNGNNAIHDYVINHSYREWLDGGF